MMNAEWKLISANGNIFEELYPFFGENHSYSISN
jgi:hypothetical protein